jgi:hypothetical protein
MDRGSKTILMGSTGTGKTHSIMTFLDAGVTPFCIFTEPRWAPLQEHISAGRIHMAYVPPISVGFDELLKKVTRAGDLSWTALAGQTSDPDKSRYARSLINLYSLLVNFTDQEGKEWGSVSEWGPDRALVLDGLSGLNKIAMQFVCGQPVSKSQPQWGAAMEAELTLISKLCYDTSCFFVLISHLEKALDEVMGGTLIQPLALGRKVAPELPRTFDDVVLARRDNKAFYWSTNDPSVDLKFTYLPNRPDLPPSFKPLVEEWRRRHGIQG